MGWGMNGSIMHTLQNLIKYTVLDTVFKLE